MINLLIISVLLFFGLAILVPHFYPRIIARNKTTAEVVEVVVENRTFIPKSGGQS